MGTSKGVRGPQSTDCSRPNVVCRDCFPVSNLSPSKNRDTGQAGLGSDLDSLCPEWVPVLPAGDSAATPVLGLVGSSPDAPAQGGGSRTSWRRVWNQEYNREAIELSAEPPPGCPQALSAGTRKAHASLGGVGIPGRNNCVQL